MVDTRGRGNRVDPHGMVGGVANQLVAYWQGQQESIIIDRFLATFRWCRVPDAKSIPHTPMIHEFPMGDARDA